MVSSRWLVWGVLAAGLVTAVPGAAFAQTAPAGTLDAIRQSGTIRLAYRPDAAPFSFNNNAGQPAGFVVALCRSVAKQIQQQLNLPSLNVTYVPVTAVNRFDAIRQGKADLLCDSTSATLDRRKIVDFSISTYVDGASLLARGDGPSDLRALAGRPIGVLAGTTTEEALANTLKAAGVTATVIPAKTYTEGLAMLDAGKIVAYFGDRMILQTLMLQSKAPDKLVLASNYLTIEPYALAMRRGDEDFRLAVDTGLSRIYRSKQIQTIYADYFGANAVPSPVLLSLYLVSAYPE